MPFERGRMARSTLVATQNQFFEFKSTPDRGGGVFAKRCFDRGETVMVGIVREVLSENSAHASQIGENEYVIFDGLINKLNHSCSPNCGIRENESGGHDYVAMRRIGEGEELTVDYALRNFRVEHFPDSCCCGSSNCRGRITGWKDLPSDRKEAYAGFVAPYLLDLALKYPSTNPERK